MTKRFFFGVMGLCTLFVLWNNERFLLNAAAPEWERVAAFGRPMIPHAIGGAVALLLGALQFSTSLRRRWPQMHRRCGMLYLVGAFAGGVSSFFVVFVNNPPVLMVETFLQSGLWMLFSALAYRCIRRRQIAQHREWMIRSYAMVLVFVTTRVVLAVPAIAATGLDGVVMVVWSCLVLHLVAAQFVIDWPRLQLAIH
jgi:uncharacterized membrane protein